MNTIDIVRDTAVNILLRVEEGAFLDSALDKALHRRVVSDRGRRFLTQLVYGTVRHKTLSDHILKKRVHEPMGKLPLPILTILRMGVFQALFCNQVTFPAMVHTSVELARKHGHAGTARLVNAVLRRVPTSLDEVRLPEKEIHFVEYLSIRYSLPRWIVEEWRETYGDEQTEALCTASNLQAPTLLRVNTLKTDRETLQAGLIKAGYAVQAFDSIPEALTVVGEMPPARSKLFQDGHYLIQDAASMLPSHLLEPKGAKWVLDLCAAPGGKTTHLAQLADEDACIVASDISLKRLRRIQENIARLDMEETHTIDLICADGIHAPFQPVFDRVLVDAPCTGLGTLRRHPDLKWRLTQAGRLELAEVQTALLNEGIRLCKNGGLIVYSVCTFSREETTGVVEKALAEGTVSLEDGPECLNQWKIATGQYQTLPTNEGLDGFFLTRLRKVS